MSVDASRPWLTTRAQLHGAGEAVRFADRRITWAELATQAESVAARLAELGVARGDIVALRMPPQPRMIAILHALQMLGAAMLPLNSRLAAPEVERILSHARPRLLLDDPGMDGIAVDVPGMRVLSASGDLDAGGARKSFASPTLVDPDAALTIVYTSGTTADPKGVVLTNANYAAGAAASRARLGHGPDDVWLATLPLFHVGGLAILARSVLEGSRIVLEAGFDASRALAVLESGEATMISMVPTMLVRVLDTMGGATALPGGTAMGSAPAMRGAEANAVSPRVRCVLIGGAALSPALARRALDAGLPIAATYGMTEACSQICSTTPGSPDAATGLVGRPLDGIAIRIGRPDRDGIGEIAVRGPTVMRGYLRNADADRAAMRDEWLHTGDRGRIDDEGRLTVAGRSDDLIVSGGENVAPTEVEHVLDEHPDVRESIVVGIADETWGQRVVALVVARTGCAPSPEALKAWCRTRIASYKIPREFRFVDALARGATGKLLRRNIL